MKPTNQETIPTDDVYYETLKTTIKNLNRCDLESVALSLAELCDEQDKTIKGHEEFADQLLPLIKDAYPQYDGPSRVQDEVPVTYSRTVARTCPLGSRSEAPHTNGRRAAGRERLRLPFRGPRERRQCRTEAERPRRQEHI